VNADKLNNGALDVTLATSALLEEFGHALDCRLNGGAYSPGYEGQLFAAEVSGVVLTAEQRAVIDAEDDTAVLMIEGVEVLVEQAGETNSWTGATSTALTLAGNYAAGASVAADGNQTALFVFGREATTRTFLDASAQFKVNRILFEGATSFTLSNTGQFFFVGTNDGITQSSSAAQTLAGGISVSDGPLTLSGDGAGLVTLSGTSNDYASKGLSKTGSSAFLLSSGNALTTGTVTISGGTLALGSTTSLLGQIQLRGGVLATSGTFTRTLGTGTASVNFGAGGGGFAAYGGPLTVSTALGTWASTTNGLADSTPLILGSSIANNVVTLSQGLNLGASARTIQLVDNTNSANDAAVMSGVISGTGGGLTLTGSGTLTLSGTNTYTGVTTLSGGVLSVATIGNGGVAGNLGSATNAAGRLVFDGGTLRYTGATASTDRGFTLNAGKTGTLDVSAAGTALTMSGASTTTTGALTKAGDGTLILSGANRHTGTTTISAGALNLRNATGLGTTAGGTTVASGAALQIQNNITVGAEALTLSGTGQSSTGALLNVSGNNTYGGAITRAAATTVGSTAGTLTLSGAMTGDFATTFTGAGNITGSGVISGTGAVTKSGAGTLSLTGSNTYTGGTTLSAGTLDVSGAAGALTATSAVDINGGTLLLSGSAANRISNGASISLGGATDTKLQLSGAVNETLGAMTLSGSGTRVIDFGSTSGVLTFASLSAASPLSLQIWNWSGTTGTGGGTDRLIISSGSLGGSLSTSNISFYSDSGITLVSGAAGFNATSGELVAIEVDTIRPTIAITSNVSFLKAGETATITFTLSEASTDFTSADVSATGGTISNFAGSGTSYTATFTPTANSTTNGVISVASATFSDAAGNTNQDGADANNTVNLTVDTIRPTIAISSNASTLKAGETASLTFTLSKASTDFTAADVSATGGTLSNFSGSGTAYTATFTPATNSTANGVISVASATFSDAAGNTNNDGADTNNTVTLTVDTIRPTIAISSNVSTLKAGETATISFTLSEASTDFTSADVSATGGSLSNFTGSGTAYTATFTPTPNSTANGVISVASATFSDAAGNTNNDGADANNTVTLTVDTTPPTLSITTPISTDGFVNDAEDESSLTISGTSSGADGQTVTVTVVGSTYTGTIAAGGAWSISLTSAQVKALSEGTVNITADVSDAAGNPATQATASFTYDRSAPAAPTFSLASDTGSSNTAGVTNNGTFNVLGVEPIATWQYSSDGGNNWTTGSNTSFTLAGGTYAAGAIQVRQIDLAGNTSPLAQNAGAITVDATAPVVTISALVLSADTGSSSTDGITNTGSQTIKATLSAALAAASGSASAEQLWASADNGTTWTNISSSVSGRSVSWATTLSGSGTIVMQVRDAAGNAGTTSAGRTYTIDLTAPTTTATVTSAYEGTAGPLISNGGTSNGTAALQLNGTLSTTLANDESVRVFDGSTFIGIASVTAGSGSWSYIDGRILPSGQTVNYTARVADTAGNQSASTTTYAITQTTAAPVVSVKNVSVVEGAASTTTQALFTVSLSRSSTKSINVTYQFLTNQTGTNIATYGTSSSSGADYTVTTVSQTLTFNPGVVSLTVPFTVYGDGTVENDETITFQLSNPKEATFANGVTTPISATGKIVNDDSSSQPSDPNQGITLTSSGNFSGAEKNDRLTGDSGINSINGLAGNDLITGMGGADILTGGAGADTFRYSNPLSESSLASMDFITDFNVAQGDKIDLTFTADGAANSVFNRGVISASTQSAAFDQALQSRPVNEVVIFQWGTTSLRLNTYIASSDGVLGNSGDLLIKLPNAPGTIVSSTFI